jgi:hypothetical protein
MAQSLSSAALSNSAARADLIRAAVRWIAEREGEAKALNAEIRAYKSEHIKGELGFKIADFNAVYRVSQLEVEDRDILLHTVREGFAALGIGQSVDWVAAAEATPRNHMAPADNEARRAGREDGLRGIYAHADEYPQGEPGHGDYMLGFADGEAEANRVMELGNGAEAPRRGRGRPRKQQHEVEADAEF